MFVIINQKEFCDYVSYFLWNSHYYMTMSRLFESQKLTRINVCKFYSAPYRNIPIKNGHKTHNKCII